MDELKPCPFCSSFLVRTGVGEWMHPDGGKCVLKGYRVIYPENTDAWNTRAPDERDKEIETITRLLEHERQQLVGVKRWADLHLDERDKRIAELEAALQEAGDWIDEHDNSSTHDSLSRVTSSFLGNDLHISEKIDRLLGNKDQKNEQ